MFQFILGLDGLEYHLLEKWNLTNLKQREYGKITVPIERKAKVPVSPEVWASFLTERDIKKKFSRSIIHRNTLLEPVRLLRRDINVSLEMVKMMISTNVQFQMKLMAIVNFLMSIDKFFWILLQYNCIVGSRQREGMVWDG